MRATNIFKNNRILIGLHIKKIKKIEKFNPISRSSKSVTSKLYDHERSIKHNSSLKILHTPDLALAVRYYKVMSDYPQNIKLYLK